MAKKTKNIRILKQYEVPARILRDLNVGESLWIPFKFRAANHVVDVASKLRREGYTIEVDVTDDVYGVLKVIARPEAGRAEFDARGAMGAVSAPDSFSEKEAANG